MKHWEGAAVVENNSFGMELFVHSLKCMIGRSRMNEVIASYSTRPSNFPILSCMLDVFVFTSITMSVYLPYTALCGSAIMICMQFLHCHKNIYNQHTWKLLP